MVVGGDGTLPNLLERLSKKKEPMVFLENRDKDIKLVNGMRVALLHGLFMPDTVPTEDTRHLLPFVFDLYHFVNEIVASFDRDTGKAVAPARSVCLPANVADLRGTFTALTPDADLAALRDHNLRFGPDDSQDYLLLQTEGALSMVLVEAMARKALRLLPESDGPEKFRDVVEQAVFGAPKRLTIFLEDELSAIDRMCRIRNTILHGNYEQAAREAGCQDVPHYFKTAFTPDVEWMFQIYRSFLRQGELT